MKTRKNKDHVPVVDFNMHSLKGTVHPEIKNDTSYLHVFIHLGHVAVSCRGLELLQTSAFSGIQ